MQPTFPVIKIALIEYGYEVRSARERGFKVYLVSARHTKNLPGRKSGVQESYCIAYLPIFLRQEMALAPCFELLTRSVAV
jgi:hypothetical protein